MRYINPEPITRIVAQKALGSRDPAVVCDALVRIALHDVDWRWAQEVFLEYVNSRDNDVRGVAVTCIGHLARIHRRLDLERVLPVLESMLSDPDVGGRAEDAISDIGVFIMSTEEND
jgi:hypothetical protein